MEKAREKKNQGRTYSNFVTYGTHFLELEVKNPQLT